MLLGLLSLVVVYIICAFWIVTLSKGLYKSYSAGKQKDDAHSGRIVTGTIKSSTTKGGGRFKMMSILVEFPNLSNSKVEQTFSFKDTKPELNRYAEGQSIQLLIQENGKSGPSVQLSGAEKRRSMRFVFILFILWAGALYGTYLIHGITETRLGGDWSNLEPLAENPVVAMTGSILLVTLLFIAIVFKAVGILPNKKKGKRDNELLLNGIRATAQIMKQEETGTRINNQPVIRFHYSYKTDFGAAHVGKDQMVLGAIELAQQVNNTETEILYDRDQPENSRMIQAMNKNSIQGCVGLIFLFMALIFSSIIIGMYIVQPV